MVVKPRAPRRSIRWLGRRSAGLGIDIGLSQTKIVWLERSTGHPGRVLTAVIPTGIVDPAEVDHVANGPGSGHDRSHQKTAAQERRAVSPNPFCASHLTLDGPVWSAKQLNLLTNRISNAIGNSPQVRKSEMNIALSMTVCDLRNVYVPPELSRNRDAIHNALVESLGDDGRRCIAPLPSEKSKSKHRLFSVSESLAWRVAKAFEQQRFIPNRIDGLPWCLARAANKIQDLATDEISVVVDWCFGRPTLAAIVDGEIDYVRCLTSGGLKEMTSPAMLDLGFSQAQASRWLQHCLDATAPHVNDSFEDTQNWVQLCCSKLADEINVAIEFIRWRNQDKKVLRVCLVGGGARSEYLLQKIQKDLCVQAFAWRQQIAETELTAEFATAASLAMKGRSNAR